MIYNRRDEQVKALRWDTIDRCLQDVFPLFEGLGVNLVSLSVDERGQLRISYVPPADMSAKAICVSDGCWLLRRGLELELMTDEDFSRLYEPVPDMPLTVAR